MATLPLEQSNCLLDNTLRTHKKRRGPGSPPTFDTLQAWSWRERDVLLFRRRSIRHLIDRQNGHCRRILRAGELQGLAACSDDTGVRTISDL